MNNAQPNLILRDIRLILQMKSGWQFGHDTVDYFAKKRRRTIHADSIDELLDVLDPDKSPQAPINIKSLKGIES